MLMNAEDERFEARQDEHGNWVVYDHDRQQVAVRGTADLGREIRESAERLNRRTNR